MKKTRVILVITTIAMLLVGCGNKSVKIDISENEIDLSKVTLVIGDQANGTKTKLEAAKVLAGAPYKIEWANFQGAAPLFEAVRSGKVDTAPAGDTPVLSALASGVQVKIVAANYSSAKSVGIIVPKDSPIKSISDLKGKTVIVSSAKGSISEYLLIQALKEAGLSINDVTVKYILPTDAIAAFASGNIEVWATFDPYFAIAESQGARILRDGENINTGLGFITASDSALADPAKAAAISDFLKRSAKATEWVNNNLDEYVKVYSSITKLDEGLAKTVLSRQGKVATRPVSDEDITKVQKVADVFLESKALPKAVDVKSFVNKTIFTDK
jgi:sulfonate transport system substrate-binding protein